MEWFIAASAGAYFLSLTLLHDAGKPQGMRRVGHPSVACIRLAPSTVRLSARLGPINAAKVMVQIADALAFIHGKGYVHSGVKPENILFTRDGMPRLAKTVKALATVSRSEPACTPSYAALEQKGGKPAEKSDSQALGLVLYEATTGRPSLPLEGLSSNEIISGLEKGKALSYESTGSWKLDEVILSCVRVKPEERISVAEARDELAELILKR